MPATDQQLRAIAFLAVTCRPHGARTWDEAGVFANLTKVRDRSLGSITIAAIQAAEDRNAETPGVIPTPGPHWRTPQATPTTTADKVDPAAHCATCGHTETACRMRWVGDHDYVPVARARGMKADPDRAHQIVTAIKAEVAPTAPPPEPRSLDDFTPNPHAETARTALATHAEETTDDD